ncbi:hypothetical protein [Sphingomonas antarctica]|uniref:hypothetical protein n=1 Tax=Sphingomonas antarctica TaxID=2040274 RepID=UPI0039E74C87
MKDRVKLRPEDSAFAVKAYSRHPEGSAMNLSTLAIYDDDTRVHEAAPWSEILDRLAVAGFITVSDVAYWSVDPTTGPIEVGIFSLTPLGREHAQEQLKSRLARTWSQRFHGVNWTTWGGVSAVIAAVASIIAIVLAWLALIK